MTKNWMRRLVVLTVAGVGLGAAGQQDASFARWRIKDNCIHMALLHFPDHDSASLQKRDAEVDTCLAASNLPPVAHLAQPTPVSGEGAAPPNPNKPE